MLIATVSHRRAAKTQRAGPYPSMSQFIFKFDQEAGIKQSLPSSTRSFSS